MPIREITPIQKMAIESLLEMKRLDFAEVTLDALGVIIDEIDLLSHQEAKKVIMYCNSFL